jgi:hypothetical protein
MTIQIKPAVKVYENPNGRFFIWALPNDRYYDGQIERNNDKIFAITCAARYAYFTDDLCQMIYWLIKNKQTKGGQEGEIRKIMKAIHDSLEDSGNYNIPISNIQVCKFSNCKLCPYNINGQCTSEGGTMMKLYLEQCEDN